MSPDSCDLCGGSDFRRLPYYYVFEGRRLYGARCRGCGLITVSPKPSRDELARLYGEEYFKGDYHCGHRDASYEEAALGAEHQRILGTFAALKPHGRMLEVGSAGGRFLAAAREKGYSVMGVEVSPEACRLAAGLGIEHFCGELEDARLPEGSFDAAYLGDVLEHLPAPLSSLYELHRVMAPGGVVGISCPTNIGLLSSRFGLFSYALLGRERAAPIPPYHLYEFTPGDIKRILAKAGFTVIKSEPGIIPPWRIMLRGSAFERLMKAALHWPNYIITKLTGHMGDRVTIFAERH